MRLLAVALLSGCAFIDGPCSMDSAQAVCEQGGTMIIVPSPRPLLRPAPSDGSETVKPPSRYSL